MDFSWTARIAAATALAVTAAIMLTSCGGSSQGTTVASPSPSPTFTALSLTAACKLLRADILANGGSPDRATLRQVIGHSTDGHLISDAQQTLREVGNGGGLVLQYDLSVMGRDCRRTGVQIPQG